MSRKRQLHSGRHVKLIIFADFANHLMFCCRHRHRMLSPRVIMVMTQVRELACRTAGLAGRRAKRWSERRYKSAKRETKKIRFFSSHAPRLCIASRSLPASPPVLQAKPERTQV